MPLYRYYKDPIHEEILTDKEHHHFFNVVKGKKGTIIELIDGKGTLAQAEVLATERNKTLYQIKQIDHYEKEEKTVHLCMSMIKQSRLEWAVEKCVELGVTHFHLFPTDQSERKVLYNKDQERLQTIAIAALKQCGRLYLPSMSFYSSMYESYEKIEGEIFFCSIEGKQPQKNKHTSSTIYIGPESGWSEKEERFFLTQGGHPTSLGKYTLRSETAAIAAVAMIIH